MKAGRPCTVCNHPERREIERAAAKGEATAAIARRFAQVSRRSLDRHLDSHAPKAMERAAMAIGGRDLAAGLGLNEEAADLFDRTVRILDRAEVANALPVALMAIREARGNLELLGKFTGKLKPEAAATSLNVFLAGPSWAAVEAALATALAPHPAAAEDVGKALARLAEGRDAG